MTRNTKNQTLRGRLRQIFLFSWRDCAVCVGILAAAALLCALLRMIDSSDVYVALIFECAVVLVSRFTDGYLFGLLASVIGVVGVNWIFTYPYMQLNFTISGYPLTFLVMLAVSVVVGTLTTQIKQQEKLRAEAEREKMRGNLLRAVSHDIRTPLTAIVGGIDAILETAVRSHRKPAEICWKICATNPTGSSAWWKICCPSRVCPALRISKGAGGGRRGSRRSLHEIQAALSRGRGQHHRARYAAYDPDGYHSH